MARTQTLIDSTEALLVPSVFPGSCAVHLAVVLRQVALDPLHICVRNVDAATSTLHDAASRHHCAWHSDELALDDIADQQLVRREVVFAFRVVQTCVSRYF